MSASAAGTLRIGGSLDVNRLGLGAMRITGPGIWGEPPDREAAKAVLRRAVELEVNFIDTADSYGPYVSEELIAEALHPYPRDLVIATKGGLTRQGPSRWQPDGRPEHLRDACEGSLRRLRVDELDIYQLHCPDKRIPFSESVGALADLCKAGKIRNVGLSNVDPGQLQRAREIVPIASVQNHFNLVDRQDAGMVELCDRQGIAYISYSPLAAGRLTTAAIRRIADAHGTASIHVAIAWLLATSPMTLPIPGTSSIAHLEENVAAAGLRLSPEELETAVRLSISERSRRFGERAWRLGERVRARLSRLP